MSISLTHTILAWSAGVGRVRQTGNGAHKKGAKRGGGEGTLSGGESCTESFLLPRRLFP